MSEPSPTLTLEEQASEFADELTRTISAALGNQAVHFVAEASPVADGLTRRVLVRTRDSEVIPLRIDGNHQLSLVVNYECAWDHRSHYLAIRTGNIKVETADRGAPLFRYEFVSDMNDSLPSAHLHVHAHRDEFLFAMFCAGHGKPATRAKAVVGRRSDRGPNCLTCTSPWEVRACARASRMSYRCSKWSWELMWDHSFKPSSMPVVRDGDVNNSQQQSGTLPKRQLRCCSSWGIS